METCSGVMPKEWEYYLDPRSGCIWMWNGKTEESHWLTQCEWEAYRDPASDCIWMWNPKTEQFYWLSESHFPSDACGELACGDQAHHQLSTGESPAREWPHVRGCSDWADRDEEDLRYDRYPRLTVSDDEDMYK